MDDHPVDIEQFQSRRSTVYGQQGVVATSQPLAAQAGISILQDGGNAFDAAVGTAAALNVVEPTSTGIGGDVFAMYRTADGEIGAMRSCGGAPQDATIETIRDRMDGDNPSMPETGPHTVTVPGTARGWEQTIEEFGILSMSDVLEPAIQYAIDGYPVSEVISEQWKPAEKLFQTSHAKEAYLIDGRSPQVGEEIRLPRLGKSLAKIADEGADVVYEGEIAEAIVNEVQEHGGVLSMNDMASFEPEFIDPISTTYNGATVYELPPNNQGPIALEALNIAEELDVGDYENETERIHYLIEAMKHAFHDGHYYITDPEYKEVPALESKRWAQRRADRIESTASDPTPQMIDSPAEDADTVLLTVADDEGNVVSYINSRFMGFGSGLVAGNTGIALQNRGASFTLDPNHPNCLEPGKRPFHTLIPGLVQFDENDWAAFGVMGGYMQPQGHLQVLTNLIDQRQPLQQALDSPRWRYRSEGVISVEPEFPDEISIGLSRKGHNVRVDSTTAFGGAQISRYNDGTLSAATEPRKDGNAQAY